MPVATRPFTGTLTLPVSTGAQALSDLGLSVGVLQLVAFGPWFISEVPDWVPKWVGSVIVIVSAILWLLWGVVALSGVVSAWKRRASDLVLSPGGLRVVAGKASGFSIGWPEVDACEALTEALDDELVTTLRVNGRVIATTTHADEAESFSALADTVQAMARPVPPMPVVAVGVVSVRCSSCGATVPPSRAAHVRCGHCHASVAMPADVRERVLSADVVTGGRAWVERALATVTRQRGARMANLLTVVMTPPLLVGFPLTSLVFNELRVTRHIVRNGHALWMLIFAAGLTGAGYLLLQAQVTSRRAVRVVVLTFAARPPERDGEPWGCRSCGAPLPESTGIIATCVYCRAPSLTGFDLRGHARTMAGQLTDLEQTLRDYVRRRRALWVLTALAATLVVVSAAAIDHGFPRTCRNGIRDGDETDVDCGGQCTRCADSRACRVNLDCVSALCQEGACAVHSCTDGVKNGGESDVDCGGPCSGCKAGDFCAGRDADCASGHCGIGGQCE